MTLLLSLFIWVNFLGPFNNRRNGRDCAAMLNLVNYDGPCDCFGYAFTGIDSSCDVTNGETLCFGSTNETQYCATMLRYVVSSESRSRNRFSNIAIKFESVRFNNVDTSWLVRFDHKDATIPTTYDGCYMEFSNTTYYECKCEVCDSGVDFKYDCSVWGGPIKNETCTSITSLIPTSPN